MPNPIYTYIKYMISKHILHVTFLYEPKHIFLRSIKSFHLFLSNMKNSIYY